MSRKHYSLLFSLCLLTGLLGSMIANQFFPGKPAFAKKVARMHTVVAAEEFRLVDKDGKVLSTWGMYAGGPGMVLFSKTGQFRAVFSLTSPEEGPVLTFADKDGNHRAIVGLGAKRQPYLTLRDKAGKERLTLSLDDEGEPYVALYDKQENERVIVGTVDLTKIKRTGFIEKRSVSSLVLLEENGEVSWKAP